MRSMSSHKYGPPEILQLEDVPVPNPKSDEVRVKILYTTINDWDWSLVRGKPAVYRLFYGLRKPKFPIFGVELSGVVDTVGEEVTKFKTGDRVYGDISGHGWGSWAEYACVKESDIRHMPGELDFMEASTIPHAFGLAWQGLIDVGQLQQDQSVLINGGGGGVGAFGIRIAKMMNADVTGVDHKSKLNKMKAWGYDEVIDYESTNFRRQDKQYDLILDTRTRYWPLSYLGSLKKEGKYVTVGGGPGRILQLLGLKPLVSLFGKKSLHMVALKPNEGLEHVEGLVDRSNLNTITDGPYPLEEIPEQLKRFGAGKHKGKIVITIE